MAEGDLVGRKLGRPTEADAAFLGGFAGTTRIRLMSDADAEIVAMPSTGRRIS